MCVIDPWAHMSLVHSILSLKLGVTQTKDTKYKCDNYVGNVPDIGLQLSTMVSLR